MFASLRHSNYRRFFLAQVVSTIGIWMHLIAENWLVVELSGGSGVALGVTAALQFMPSLVLGLHVGVLVDRSNRRHLLVLTQSAAGAIALALWALAATDVVALWMIWVAAALSGTVTCVDVTARQAFTKELVGVGDVTNAVALNNGVATAARMIGPAAAGVLIAATDVSTAFLANGLTFVAVIVVLLTLDVGRLYRSEPIEAGSGQVREGLAYVWDEPVLRTVVVMMFLAFTFAYNFQVLMPLLASETLGGDSQLYGYLMSAMGAGALVGSLLAASRTWTGRGPAVVTALFLAVAQAAVAVTPERVTAAVAAMAMGVAASVFMVTVSGTLQKESRDDARGRVMSLYSIAFVGTGAIGGPAVGGIADLLGPRAAFGFASLSCLAAAAVGRWWLVRPREGIAAPASLETRTRSTLGGRS